VDEQIENALCCLINEFAIGAVILLSTGSVALIKKARVLFFSPPPILGSDYTRERRLCWKKAPHICQIKFSYAINCARPFFLSPRVQNVAQMLPRRATS
jgi:hypothetical protein